MPMQTLDRPKSEQKVAGGQTESKFDWQEVWHPIAYIQDLNPSELTTFTLLDQDLVIWWDPKHETWRVFHDRCPHRLVPLSQGRVNEAGHLECPYHGWTFSGGGACESIPQQTQTQNAHTSKRACVKSLPTAIRQGLLFVYPGQPENAPEVEVPVIQPMEDEPEGWVCLNTFRDLPYDALTLLENVLDASHVPFTHHNTVSDRANASPVNLSLLEVGRQGFTGTWPEGPRKGQLGQQDTTFIAPNLMWHDLTSKQYGRTMTVVYATPIRKGECRVFARFPFKFSSKVPGFFMKLAPQWYSHISQNAILEDDQIFLHYQERYLAQAGGSGQNAAQAFYLPTKADQFVSALHQWIHDFDAEPFPIHRLPAALDNAALLDRYHSHTRHCASCSGALRRIKALKKAAIAITIISLATVPILSVGVTLSWGIGLALTLVPLILSGAAYGLHQLEQRFYVGREIPPRNLKKG